MVMKIENYEGTADTFTFPNNPKSFDDSGSSNATTTTIDYQKYHIHIGGRGVNVKNQILSGFFFGTNKNTDYQSLSKHFNYEDDTIKKLYWDSDKFSLGFGLDCKKTHSGGRTNFLDYVSTFKPVISILFGDTQKTTGTNDGNVRTFIEEITGTVTSGASDITISDGVGNAIKIPASSLTTGHSFSLKLIKMVDSGDGVFVSEYNYVEINGTQIKTVQTTDGFGLLQLDAAANVSTISTSNLTSASVKFRDGWSA